MILTEERQILDALKAPEPQRAYLLTGGEPYLRDLYLEKILARRPKTGDDFAYQHFDGGRFDLQELAAAVEAVAFLSDRRYVYLQGLEADALSAADSVIVPVQCEYFAMEAVGAILSSIANVQKRLNPRLKIEGFLLTMYDSRTALGNEISSQVRSLFKENTFLVSIPRNQSIVDSQASCLPVTEFRPSSAGAVSYFSLAREVIDHEER